VLALIERSDGADERLAVNHVVSEAHKIPQGVGYAYLRIVGYDQERIRRI
jgi:hypothetical protein